MGTQVGKLGPAVGSMWKGRNVYRAYNPFVKNPRTEKQLLVRARFKTMADLARAFAQATNFGYKRLANNLHTTTRGLFHRDNWPAVHANTVDSVTIDYADLVCAKGDIVILFAYCPDAKCGVMSPTTGQSVAKRSDGSVSLDVPAYWNGMKVHVWGFAITSVQEPTYIDAYGGYIYPNTVSDSLYIGTGNIS